MLIMGIYLELSQLVLHTIFHEEMQTYHRLIYTAVCKTETLIIKYLKTQIVIFVKGKPKIIKSFYGCTVQKEEESKFKDIKLIKETGTQKYKYSEFV